MPLTDALLNSPIVIILTAPTRTEFVQPLGGRSARLRMTMKERYIGGFNDRGYTLLQLFDWVDHHGFAFLDSPARQLHDHNR